jgi:hypothetical protein
MIFLCRFLVLLVAGSWLALGGRSAIAAPLPVESVLQLHFLGTQQIAADTNSATLRSVWRLPETRALVAQTIDKLSRLPARGPTNAVSARLRPLLDDFVTSEFYLTLDAATNAQLATLEPRVLLAVRLSQDRDRLWRSNLAAVLTDLTGSRPVREPAGWLLQSTNAPKRVRCWRAHGWTFLASGTVDEISESRFADEIANSSKQAATNCWLEADINPSRLGGLFPALDSHLSPLNLRLSGFKHLHLTGSGEGGQVHTAATLDFFQPLPLPLPPWEIPTNLIHGPLTSFTAVRGIDRWLAKVPLWQKLQLAPPPDQAFVWAQTGAPFLTYAAFPMPAATNQLAQLAPRLVHDANVWLATNNVDGRFQCPTNLPGIVSVFPIIAPFLKSALVNQHDFLLGGLFPLFAGNSGSPPAEIPAATLETPGLVYCETEHTRLRMSEASFIAQWFRIVFNKPGLPVKSAAVAWLLGLDPLFGDTTTIVTRSQPAQLCFNRRSTVGFNALELCLLADWLESPQFPRGLHTFLAPPDPN